MLRACWLAVALWLSVAAPSLAATAPEPPRLQRHVTDLTGTLDAAQVAQLESTLAALEQRKGAQLVVLLVPTTGDRPIEDYALAVAERTQLGRKGVDDGLLLLVATEDRKARIEVGYGLEGVVTDALASRVIREYLAPRFREGDAFGGVQAAVDRLVKLVDGEPLPPPMAAEPGQDASPLFTAGMVGLFVGLFAGATRLRPLLVRRVGAGGVAALIASALLGLGIAGVLSAIIAFLLSGGSSGRFGSGRGGWGTFPGTGGGWGGGHGGGGGWSGGGGSFGGGGASGGW